MEHCCGKELESLCACLGQLAGLLPGEEAAAVGRWAVAACQSSATSQVCVRLSTQLLARPPGKFCWACRAGMHLVHAAVLAGGWRLCGQ